MEVFSPYTPVDDPNETKIAMERTMPTHPSHAGPVLMGFLFAGTFFYCLVALLVGVDHLALPSDCTTASINQPSMKAWEALGGCVVAVSAVVGLWALVFWIKGIGMSTTIDRPKIMLMPRKER